MTHRMPILRDVRVKNATTTTPRTPTTVSIPAIPARSTEAETSGSNLVTVMGFDTKDVLFRSTDVGCVQWRDSEGNIVALLIRLKPDIWGFSHRGDDDWEQILARYGNQDIK